MTEWFLGGGIIMWPMLVLGIGVVASALRAGLRLRRAAVSVTTGQESSSHRASAPSLVPILFWGAVALLVGALGTATGLVIMARNTAAAGGGSARLVWGGVSLALISLVFGIVIFLISGLLWFTLDAWARRVRSRSGRSVSTILLVMVTGTLATACGAGDAGRFVVMDSAGITVMENLGPDRGLPVTPVRVGSLQPPDSALTAMPWAVVADPEAGRIFVADGTGERVIVFDENGRFVRTIGRAGDGPGEFRSPTALALDPGGVVAVWDAGRGVISRWSAKGELRDEQRAPIRYWGPGFATRGDGVVAVTQSTTGTQRRQSLVEAHDSGEPVELFAVTRELVPLNLPGMSMPAPRIFAPDLIWTTAGDTVLVLNGPEYRIDALAHGGTVTSIRRDIPPIAVTRELAAARVGSGPYGGFLRRTGITADQMVSAVGFEEVASPIEWLAVAPAGRLWVSRGTGLPVPDRVDVFAPDGRYEGTFNAPGFPVAFLSDTVFVALEITDLGEPVLGLYRLLAAAAAPLVSERNPGQPGPQGSRTPADASDRSSAGAAVSATAWSPPPPDAELEPGDEFRDCPHCPVMVVLPRGRFLMGSPEGEAVHEVPRDWLHLLQSEKPQVEIEVGYALAAGKYEVTFSQWDRCVAAGGCSHDPDDLGFGRGDRPVLNVDREQGREYLTWLSDETGHAYRLPSEAEWEYAARGASTTARPWGDRVEEGRAVCEDCGSAWDGRSTAPVGSFPANGFGLHDVMGNLFEWVSDCFERGYMDLPTDGSPRLEGSPYWENGTCTVHIRRGGSWSVPAWELRSARRKAINTQGPWGLAGDRSAGFRAFREIRQ